MDLITALAPKLVAGWLVSGLLFGAGILALAIADRLPGAARRRLARLALGLTLLTLAAILVVPLVPAPVAAPAAEWSGMSRFSLQPSAALAAVTEHVSPLSLVPVAVVACWGFGLLVGLGRLAAGAVRVHRVAQAATRDGEALVYRAPVPGPCIVGWRHPRILLPRDVAYTQQELVAILAHEREHLRSGDLPWLWLMRLVALTFWWQPAGWIFERRLRLACEQAADAAALQASPSLGGYLDTLLRTVGAREPVPVAAMGGFQTELGQRIAHLTRPGAVARSLASRLRYAGAAFALGLTSATLAVAALGLSGCGPAKSPYETSLVEAELWAIYKRAEIHGAEWADREFDRVFRQHPNDPNVLVHSAARGMQPGDPAKNAKALAMLDRVDARRLSRSGYIDYVNIRSIFLQRAGRGAEGRALVEEAIGRSEAERWGEESTAWFQRLLADRFPQ